MALPSNTQATYDTIGVREDLENKIYKVSANKTPFTSSIGSAPVAQPYHEWETYTQRAAAANAALQGDDSAATASEQPARVGNRTQIFAEGGVIADTVQASDIAGQANALAWQEVQKANILATDIELALLSNNASVTAASGTAPKLGGIQAWLTSNVSRGAGGSSGGFSGGTVAAATNGTQRTLTEALLKTVLASGFSNGAPNIRQAYMSASHKQIASSFTGIADIRSEVKGTNQAVITAAADVYVSDFGEITMIPVQYGLTRAMVLIDPDMLAVGTLRPMKTTMLGKSGDNTKFQVVAEKTLVCRNQRGNAIIADLT
jgi:hypothetical protein